MSDPLDKQIDTWIKEYLPKLPSKDVENLRIALLVVGVKEKQDLALVERDDIIHAVSLSEIEIRHLLREWKKLDQATGLKEPEPQPQPQTSQPRTSSHLPAVKTWHFDFGLFDKELTEKLTEKENRASPDIRMRVARIIGSAALKAQGHGDKLTNIVDAFSREVVMKFKTTLADMYEGKFIGLGYGAMFDSAYHYCENQRRGKQSTDPSSSRPKKGNHMVKNAHPGAINASNEKIQENYQEVLLNIHAGPKDQWNSPDVKSMLEDTYMLQRKYINQCIGVTDEEPLLVTALKQSWPFLFEPLGATLHFRSLEEVDMNENMDIFFPKIKNLIKFLNSQGKCGVQGIAVEAKLAIVQNPSVDARPVNLIAAMQLIALYFKENINLLLFLVDRISTLEDVEKMKNLPSHPCLVCAGSSLLTCEKYFLFIDSVFINQPENALVGVKVLVASYYMLDVLFPPKISKTLELLVRLIVGNNNTKAPKTMLQIMNSFEEFSETLGELLQP